MLQAMNPDVVPYLCWRVIGLLLLTLGLAVLLLGFYCGYGFLVEVFNAADVDVVDLATFFAILSGLALGFIRSGMQKRKMRTRRLFR